MSKGLFTSSEVAQLSGIGQSTLRSYVKFYNSHLSENATKNRSRNFTILDFQVIKLIAQMEKDKLDFQSIRSELDSYLKETEPNYGKHEYTYVQFLEYKINLFEEYYLKEMNELKERLTYAKCINDGQNES